MVWNSETIIFKDPEESKVRLVYEPLLFDLDLGNVLVTKYTLEILIYNHKLNQEQLTKIIRELLTIMELKFKTQTNLNT